jgi:alkyl sulfatase BDS1-like metallo-beta-lactamase superfamily hydrolase
MREISLPPELEVGEGYGKVSWSVRAIWEYYAGWFHHDSTTELFAVPRSRINEDLVELAGGPAALVARAREKLAGEHVEEAIHLLDIVLASGPTSEALDAMIEAHEKLRSASENFWLSAWLDHQLAGLRSRRSAAR